MVNVGTEMRQEDKEKMIEAMKILKTVCQGSYWCRGCPFEKPCWLMTGMTPCDFFEKKEEYEEE